MLELLRKARMRMCMRSMHACVSRVRVLPSTSMGPTCVLAFSWSSIRAMEASTVDLAINGCRIWRFSVSSSPSACDDAENEPISI